MDSDRRAKLTTRRELLQSGLSLAGGAWWTSRFPQKLVFAASPAFAQRATSAPPAWQTPHYIDVPSDALTVKGGQPVVATITPDPVVKLRQVIVADQTGENAGLLIGLRDGERVARNFGERATKVQPVARPGKLTIPTTTFSAAGRGRPTLQRCAEPGPRWC